MQAPFQRRCPCLGVDLADGLTAAREVQRRMLAEPLAQDGDCHPAQRHRVRLLVLVLAAGDPGVFVQIHVLPFEALDVRLTHQKGESLRL